MSVVHDMRFGGAACGPAFQIPKGDVVTIFRAEVTCSKCLALPTREEADKQARERMAAIRAAKIPVAHFKGRKP